jgi:hypothetical protein
MAAATQLCISVHLAVWPCRRPATQQEIHTYVHRMRVGGMPYCPQEVEVVGPVQQQWWLASACWLPCHLWWAYRSVTSLRRIVGVQEKGWDVGQTVEKLLQTGSRLSSEAHEVVRIPNLLSDADLIGEQLVDRFV